MADAFWTSLEMYYYLNNSLYADQSLKIAAALSYFKLETPAGEWACNHQQIAIKQSPPDFKTWVDFKKAFKEHFIPIETELFSTQKIHNLKMNNQPFTEWYQDWIVHANCSGANNATKIYAFWQNLLSALHNKIMAVHPASTTLAHLVELAKEFDQIWQMYNQSNTANRWCTNLHSTEMETTDSTSVNTTNTPPHFQKFKKLSQEEKDCRHHENLCLYCGKSGHWQSNCRDKSQNRQNFWGGPSRNNPWTQATQINDDKATETPLPESPPTIFHLYAIPEHHFDLSHPDPDINNQDF